jgi:HD-like signal output (HDOD) protein
VAFREVVVRDYPITLSVNPASRIGPAIELGWDYNTEVIVPIDDFEERRHGQRRPVQSLYLFLTTRVYLLKNLDYSEEEITTAMREKDIIVNQRDMTNLAYEWSPLGSIRSIWKTTKRQRAIKKVVRNQIGKHNNNNNNKD